MSTDDDDTIIELYRLMYEHTEPECSCSCNIPRSCCSPEYCQMAIEWAQDKWGVTLEPTDHEKLPLMGPKGCIAQPHHRPLCTLHTCDIAAFGYKMLPAPDPEWDARYWQLRSAIDEQEEIRFLKSVGAV